MPAAIEPSAKSQVVWGESFWLVMVILLRRAQEQPICQRKSANALCNALPGLAALPASADRFRVYDARVEAALVLVLVAARGAHALRLPLVKRITTVGSDPTADIRIVTAPAQWAV